MWTSESDLIGMTLFGVAVLLLPALVSWALTRQRVCAVERRLRALDDQLGVFTEASIELAKTVGQPVVAGAEEITPEASRRYVLHRAMARVEDGEDVDHVLGEMGVAGDERRLMDIAWRRRHEHDTEHLNVAV